MVFVLAVTFRLIALSSVTKTCGSVDTARIGNISSGCAGGVSGVDSLAGVRLPRFLSAVPIEY